VYRTLDLTLEEVWDLGNRIGVQGSRNLHGRADTTVSNVRATGLEIEADDIPPRHAEIVGWPVSESEQQLLAIKLAAEATLVLKQEAR
jgi:hypothetical protein